LSQNTSCYVCGSTNTKLTSDKNGFTHISCDYCRFVQILPQYLIPAPDIYRDNYYNGEMYKDTNGKLGYIESCADSSGSYRSTVYEKYLDDIEKVGCIKDKGHVRLLDFGCGYGKFLQAVSRRFGENIELHGIEVDKGVCEKIARNNPGKHIHWLNSEGDSPGLSDQYYDLVAMLDVIEHLDDPRKYLNKLNACTKEGGILLLSTPNVESLNRMIYGQNWILYSPPYHTCYFGPKSIKVMLSQTGWELVHLYSERTIFHNERYLGESWRGKVIRRLFDNKFWDYTTNKLLHAGSVMVAIAKKRGVSNL
jgi:2-polyprenyl-3-methyl-5-hydroxy-6-metoxy-1,4-benzoquinol methylase